MVKLKDENGMQSSDNREQRLLLSDFRKSNGGDYVIRDWEPSLTRQEFADECDINTIMARYEAGGAISHVNRAEPMYLDTTMYPDLRGAMDLFREAALSFNALPAAVRKEFDNDPQLFVDFASDPANIGRMREWGLAPPEPTPEPPVRVELVNPAIPPGGDNNPPGDAPKPS